MTFQMLDHLAKLEPGKEKGRYGCPSCGGGNLTVDPNNGAYQCWNGCSCAEIREAIAPWSEQEQSTAPRTGSSKPRKQVRPAPLPEKIILARLPQLATDSPQPQKRFDAKHGEVEEIVYPYTENTWKTRAQWVDATQAKGYSKTFILWHRDASGKAIPKSGEWVRVPYRIEEAITASIASGGNALVGCEGEKPVEVYRQQLGLAATTLSSFSKDELALMAQMLKDAGLILVYHPDHDQSGKNKAVKVQEACDRAGVPCLVLDPVVIYPELPDKGDIVEILAAMDTPEFIRRLEEEIYSAVESQQQSESLEQSEFNDGSGSPDIPDSFDPNIEFTQQALKALYSDEPWICVNGILHRWTGIYYKSSLDALELKRLSNFCNGFGVTSEQGIRYPYAKPSKVREALDWVKIRLTADPTEINPPGLNCTNGVLLISWDGPKPSFKLVDHDPARYYLYEPVAFYNPDANPEHCDRLLEVLDKPQQEVFLRTIAGSLDLAVVRQHKGRLVRGLFLKGHGSNGKDTLRECVAAMYGYRTMTSVTLTDFASYDQGRKFPLARLNQSRVNWASENANTAKLDNIQSLKAFITGDPLSVEGKGKDEYEFSPAGVALFNINDTPNLQAALQAIRDRYGVLTFNKTFKIGADTSKGELEADPRFKYDPDFLRSNVLPAFLNKVLSALTDLMSTGIDYRCTEQALEDIQAENSHLFQFAQDTQLGYDPIGRLSVGEIWEQLKQWYIDNGSLTLETSDKGKEKSVWIDQVKKSDPNVKGANQVLARFIQLFPKAKRCNLGNNKVGIAGLAFKISQFDSEISQSLASGLASNPDTARVISHISQFPNSDGKSNEVSIDSAQGDCVEEKKLNQDEKLPQLANNPDVVRVTGSLVANELANSSGEVANSSPQLPQQSIQVDDSVTIDNPGSKYHGKQAVVVRLKVDNFHGQELQKADVSVPNEKRYIEVQMSWLRRTNQTSINEAR